MKMKMKMKAKNRRYVYAAALLLAFATAVAVVAGIITETQVSAVLALTASIFAGLASLLALANITKD